jgi:D-alanine-D-alanine ligase
MSSVTSVIFFGGTSSERKVSVASAQHLSVIIPEAELWFWSPENRVLRVSADELAAHALPYDVDFVPRHGQLVADSVEHALDQAGQKVFYLGLHGGRGENGWLQQHLEQRNIAFTGSSAQASAIAMDKSKSKEAVKSRGVLLARQLVFTPSDTGALDSLRSFQRELGDVVIKPAADGSSAGLAFISSADDCARWSQANESSRDAWMAEEWIKGRELTVGVIMHQHCLTVLPPSEVVLDRNAHFDYQAKYHGVGNKEITPAEITLAQAAAAQEVAVLAHAAIGCFGYTRTDMIMTPKGIFYLETNTLPGMTRASFIPQQLRAAGIDLRLFVEGQLQLAKQRLVK